MPSISKIHAFQSVAEAMDKNDYKTANEILSIINREIMKEKKKKTFSENIQLKSKKEEKIFSDLFINRN